MSIFLWIVSLRYFEQKEKWLADANEYLTQEEEGYQLELSVRQAGRELLNALLEVFYEETTDGTARFLFVGKTLVIL